MWQRDAGEDKPSGIIAGDPHATHNLKPFDVGQGQIEQDDIIFIMTEELQGVFTAVRLVNDCTGGFQHERYAACGDQVFFHEQDTHAGFSLTKREETYTTIACRWLYQIQRVSVFFTILCYMQGVIIRMNAEHT